VSISLICQKLPPELVNRSVMFLTSFEEKARVAEKNIFAWWKLEALH
jgi:hypothetical protein